MTVNRRGWPSLRARGGHGWGPGALATWVADDTIPESCRSSWQSVRIEDWELFERAWCEVAHIVNMVNCGVRARPQRQRPIASPACTKSSGRC